MLLLNFIIKIPGPFFLIIFSVFSIITILFAYFLNRKDGTEKLPLPPPEKLDIFSIAVLTGDWMHVLRTAVFSLYEKKIINIKKEKRLGGYLVKKML